MLILQLTGREQQHSTMPQVLPSICALIGTIPIGFGINAFLRPDNALSFFNGASLPTINANLVQALVMIYAARDIFMGIAIYATAFYGSRRALGWVMLAGGFNAFIDGLAMQTYMGGGECELNLAQVVWLANSANMAFSCDSFVEESSNADSSLLSPDGQADALTFTAGDHWGYAPVLVLLGLVQAFF